MPKKKAAPPAPVPHPWPRLSVDLTGPRHPHHCQSCGRETDPSDGVGAHAWQEYDDQDRPERVVVLLCRECSARLIEPHPRMYNRLPVNQPWPGAMDLCVRCRWRAGVRCRHPQARANGGPGVMIAVAKPHTVHLSMGGGKGGWMRLWPTPATACRQRAETERETTTNDDKGALSS